MGSFSLGSSQANDNHIDKTWQKGVTAHKPSIELEQNLSCVTDKTFVRDLRARLGEQVCETNQSWWGFNSIACGRVGKGRPQDMQSTYSHSFK